MKYTVEEIRDYFIKSWLEVPDDTRKDCIVQRCQGYVLVSLGRKGLFSNWVLETSLDEGGMPVAIKEARAFFTRLDTDFSWLIAGRNLNSPIERILLKEGFIKTEEVDILAKWVCP